MSIDIPYTRYISFECLALNKPNFPFGSSSVEVLLDIFFGRGSMLICCYWNLGSDPCASNIFLLFFHLNIIYCFAEDRFSC